ncbi:MAG TPA: asparagine synthase (glutamine-hydrolyzing) [Thermoanaerobaculia bacterium]|nr:asparagine synthase (glutamine-hydrolyzing) [Thermoanaerobaculia bacterium]
MCGINGILSLGADAPPIDHTELVRTRDAMASRGPDGSGVWVSEDGRVGLANRRLAILDLTPAGAQPMADHDGRYRIVLNGEIYNFRELRQDLERQGYVFRSQSDTEVLLALYSREGKSMLRRLRGMYSLALWDDAERTLLLARDPYGIKPLYYALDRHYLRFASQVKALEAGGAVSASVDPGGLVGFLLWGSVPEPLTIRRAVRALPAGHLLEVRDGSAGGPEPHYRFGDAAPAAEMDLAAAFADSVRAHLVSDVPVAIFLSGGLDSSLLAALARRNLPEPPITFTLSFDLLAGTPLDEAPLAAETARRLGTRHVERRVGREDFARLWPAATAAMDQPSIDGFNVYLVSHVAHEAGLKVALSGLGGDELLGSYPSFRDVPRGAKWARRTARVPGMAAAWPALAHGLAPSRPKLAGLLRHGASLAGAYFLRRGLFLPEELPDLIGRDAAAEGLAAYDPVTDAAATLDAPRSGHPGESEDAWLGVHLLESAHYMRNQLLRDADWASMAHSLELRVPLVDTRLRDGLARRGFADVRARSKAEVVRQVAPELPEAVFAKRKSGFYVPVVPWLAGTGITQGTGSGLGSRQLARRLLLDNGMVSCA